MYFETANIGQPPLVLTRKSANILLMIKGFHLRKGDSEGMPWEVYITKSVFGKKIRKRFANKAQAMSHINILEAELENKQRVSLDPEVHKIVALYAEKLTPFQIQTMLEEGVRRYSVEAKALSELVAEYLEQQQTLFEEGSVGEGHTPCLHSSGNGGFGRKA